MARQWVCTGRHIDHCARRFCCQPGFNICVEDIGHWREKALTPRAWHVYEDEWGFVNVMHANVCVSTPVHVFQGHKWRHDVTVNMNESPYLKDIRMLVLCTHMAYIWHVIFLWQKFTLLPFVISLMFLSYLFYLVLCWLHSRLSDLSNVTFIATLHLLHFILSIIQVWQSIAKVRTLKMSQTKSFVEVFTGCSVVWRQVRMFWKRARVSPSRCAVAMFKDSTPHSYILI